jgi:hypothetical protein
MTTRRGSEITQKASRRHPGHAFRRLAGWIARLQQQLAGLLFASRDAFAREHGWEITKTTGRSGFGARSYRDPRFAQSAVVRQGQNAPGERFDARSR